MMEIQQGKWSSSVGFLGKSRDGMNGLFLNDEEGNPKLMIFVDQEGNPKIPNLH